MQWCHTEDDEAGVGVGGAQGVLRGAAVHGAVELGRYPLQHQLLPSVFGAAVQESAPHTGPREEGLGEDFVLHAGDTSVGTVTLEPRPPLSQLGGHSAPLKRWCGCRDPVTPWGWGTASLRGDTDLEALHQDANGVSNAGSRWGHGDLRALGSNCNKKGQGEKGRQPSAGVNEGLLNGRGCEEAEGWMLDGQTAGWPNDWASRLDRWLH